MTSLKDMEGGRRLASSFFHLLSFRKVAALVLAVGVVQIALYWLVGMAASTDGATPIPQPDTLLYCQAARRIVEGHPFSFSAGTAVSTGTTSVVYPFLLAIPYWLGCRGNSLLTAGFLLNAFCYLVFLWGWTHAFRVWSGRPRGALFAGMLLALFGQTAFSAMSQSDIGLWMAASGLLAMGAATGRSALFAAVLTLAPWVRPEGMVCVIAFAMVAVAARAAGVKARHATRDWLLAALSMLSMAGVFAFNYWLSGKCQFSSVAGKGYFSNFPLGTAIHKTCCDLLSVVGGLFFGTANSAPRSLQFLPVWGAVFCGVGLVCLHLRQRPKSFFVMALACLGGILTVAQSGWQNTNYDRYLAWVMPLPVFLVSEGVVAVSRRLSRGSGIAGWVPSVATLGFALMGMVAALCVYGSNCRHVEGERHFMAACEKAMEPHASVGGFCGVGMAYGFSDRRFAHLAGIYSPEFRFHAEGEIIEELKHHPEKRFDYWLLDDKEDFPCMASGKDAVLGEDVLVGPAGMELRKADWQVFDRSAREPKGLVKEGTMRARIDVGFPEDERKHAYRVFDRYARGDFEPFVAVDKNHGELMVESGRLVVGGDEMRVPTIPGRPLTVVMRTLPKAAASQSDGFFSEMVTGKFGPGLSLRVTVDGREAAAVRVEVSAEGFTDAMFTIPATAILREESEIAFLGDHVACAYWFYQ